MPRRALSTPDPGQSAPNGLPGAVAGQLAEVFIDAIVKSIEAPAAAEPAQRSENACTRAAEAIQELIAMQKEWDEIFNDMDGELLDSPYGQKLLNIVTIDLQLALDEVEKSVQVLASV